MKMKYLLSTAIVLAVTSCSFSAGVCKQSNCKCYVLWGTATFPNGVKVPVYRKATEHGNLSGQRRYEQPQQTHNVYLRFALPKKNTANEFVVIRDSLGYDLAPKDLIPICHNK